MAITVLTQAWALPGEGGAMVQGWLDHLPRYSPSVRRRRFGLVFQGIDDPDQLLYLAEWSDRAAFEARAEEIGSRVWVREHARSVDVAFVDPVHTVERVLAPVRVAELARLRVPGAVTEVVEAYLRRESAIGYGTADFAVRVLYHHPDVAAHLLVYRGWSSPAGLDAYRSTIGPTVEAELRGHGVAIERFRGYTRMSLPDVTAL